jgi:hypothetical protein
LHIALGYGRVEIADVIIKHCKDEQLGFLFGLDPRFPQTLFGDLARLWQQTLSMKLEAIKWVVKHGGAAIFTDAEGSRCPVWLPLIFLPPRPRARVAALDLALFDYLLGIFPERLNFLEPVSGRSALHLAFWNGNPEATSVLLDRVN